METTTVRYHDVDLEVTGDYEGPDPDVGINRGSFALHRVEIEGVEITRLLDGLRDIHGHSVHDRLARLAAYRLDRAPVLSIPQQRREAAADFEEVA